MLALLVVMALIGIAGLTLAQKYQNDSSKNTTTNRAGVIMPGSNGLKPLAPPTR